MLVGWNPASVPNLYGKVAVITGANSGIGYETTRKLAENGAEVYMVVRNMDKGRAAVEQLRKELGPVKLHLLQADMESMSQVQSLLAELRGVRPDILLHNAGILYPGPFRLTEEGLEPTLAISYYSGVLLALGLLDQMKPRSRVIFMASAGEWPMSRLEGSFFNMRGDKFTASGARAYGQAKAFGKGSGYFGPNLLNMWHATERQPGTKQARNPFWCWRVYEETVKILSEIVGSKAMPPVPRHPDPARDAMMEKKSPPSEIDKGRAVHATATAA
ncbi:retinol dehydrogenase 12 [Haematococcus lacustris]|uniref:Retinol dehydrogenase 12 n=1 Tax=Haematococcus lacustris TaxID=44745 RepID=A0A699Y668_HAELA|nr:retinol dehydrogenase 12 [Haematococcus lacustris]